jgi:titin
MNRFLMRLFRRYSAPRIRRRVSYRPRAEFLEDRTLLTTYTVTTTADLLNDTAPGQVTLRDVITAIDTQNPSGNAAAPAPGTSTIHFAIGKAGSVQTIAITSPLPALTRPAFIDGWSQGAGKYTGPPLIVLNGANAPGGTTGVELDAGAGGSTVRGLVIQSFGGNGILVHGARGVAITANDIGTDPTGTTALGNGADGILVDGGATGTVIGGTTPGAGNLIDGSVISGPGGIIGNESSTFSVSPATITGSIASFNVTLNYTNAIGYQAVYFGIDLRSNDTTLAPVDQITNQQDFAAFSFVPSSTLGPNWTPVGNAFPGEYLVHTPPATGLAPNASYFVGTISYNLAQFGVMPTPNEFVSIEGIDTVIGVEKPGQPATFHFANAVFAPGEQPLVNAAVPTIGVEIAGSGTSGNQVVGNLIGTTRTGTVVLGQLTDGILIDGGATNNTVGSTTSGAANVIAGNNTGIVITDTGTDGNTIVGNRIGTDLHAKLDLANTVAGVLLEDGATGNTIGGTMAGSGNVIAFGGNGVMVGNGPSDTTAIRDTVLGNSIYATAQDTISLAGQPATTNSVNPRAYPNNGQNAPLLDVITTNSIAGSLTGVANTTFRIELFANPAGSAPPGQKFLGFVNTTTDGNGSANFTLATIVPLGEVITATATNLSSGDTSGISPVGDQIVILSNPTPVVSSTVTTTSTMTIQVLTQSGPPTTGQILITIPGIPGAVDVPLTGKPSLTLHIPIPPKTPGGTYMVDLTALSGDVPEGTSKASLKVTSLGAQLPAGNVSRRWTR